MKDLPKPPIPADVDLSDNDWFALHHKRLRNSRWWRRASDLARARNVMLWGWAYDQVPAGSLPDDDDELAEAAGFGMDADAFIRVKAEILAPWTLCSDGRWYHPTLVEVVIESWARTSERRKKEKAKKAAQRARARGVPEYTASVPADTPDVPGDNDDETRDIAPYAGATSIGQDKDKIEPPLPPQGGERDKSFAEALAAYPQIGRSFTHPAKARPEWERACAGETDARLISAIRSFAASAVAAEDKGLRVPSLQRWLREQRYLAWLPATVAGAWSGPPEIRAKVAAGMGEAWTRSWWDHTRWCDLPERAVVALSDLAFDRLMAAARDELGPVLAELGLQIRREIAA